MSYIEDLEKQNEELRQKLTNAPDISWYQQPYNGNRQDLRINNKYCLATLLKPRPHDTLHGLAWQLFIAGNCSFHKTEVEAKEYVKRELGM